MCKINFFKYPSNELWSATDPDFRDLFNVFLQFPLPVQYPRSYGSFQSAILTYPDPTNLKF